MNSVPPYPGYLERHECFSSCFEMPSCLVCGLRKKPIGRDAAAAFANSLCNEECPGYRQTPGPGHRWPEENE